MCGTEKMDCCLPRASPKIWQYKWKKFIADPDWASKLGRRGYLYGDNGDVPDIGEHVLAIENLYRRVISERNDTRVDTMSVPWRITFDTNPDHCNYHCTMCEEHSPYSPLQFQRRTAGYAKRVMSFDMIARNVEAMAKIGLREIIPSTMGEPLLYKQFERILHCVKNRREVESNHEWFLSKIGCGKMGAYAGPHYFGY